MAVTRTSFKKGHTGMLNEQNPHWKGEEAGYIAKHQWIRRKYGDAKNCEECGIKDSKKYEWANISGKYLRERSDYKELCSKCHYKYDNKNLHKIAKKNPLFFNRWNNRWERRINYGGA